MRELEILTMKSPPLLIALVLVATMPLLTAHDPGQPIQPMVAADHGAGISFEFRNLPEHRALEISFKVHFVGPWDGTGYSQWGPDRFLCVLDRKRHLLDATFNNCHLIWSDNIWQSFPDPHHPEQYQPSDRGAFLYHGGNGATAVASFDFPFNKKRRVNSTYTFRFLVRHSRDLARVGFATDWVEDKSSSTYWIENLKVSPLESVPDLDPKAEARAWSEFFADEGSGAQQAWSEIYALHPDSLVQRARGLVEGDEKRIARILEELGRGPIPTEALYRSVAIPPGRKNAAETHRRILLARELVQSPASLKSPAIREFWDQEEDSVQVRNLRKIISVSSYRAETDPKKRARMRLGSYLRMIGSEEAMELAQAIDPQEEAG